MSDLMDRLKKISAELDSHSDPFGDIGPAIDAAIDENARLRAVLFEITKGEGRFNIDPHIHAENVIADMIELAETGLAEGE